MPRSIFTGSLILRLPTIPRSVLRGRFFRLRPLAIPRSIIRPRPTKLVFSADPATMARAVHPRLETVIGLRPIEGFLASVAVGEAGAGLGAGVALVLVVEGLVGVGAGLGRGGILRAIVVEVIGRRGGVGVTGLLRRRERAAVGEVYVVAATVWGGIELVEVGGVVIVLVVVAAWVVRHCSFALFGTAIRDPKMEITNWGSGVIFYTEV